MGITIGASWQHLYNNKTQYIIMQTIGIQPVVKDALKFLKIHKRESYSDVIARLVKEHNENRVKPNV